MRYLQISVDLAPINTHSCLVKSPLSTSQLWTLACCPVAVAWAPSCPHPGLHTVQLVRQRAWGVAGVSGAFSEAAAVCPA